MTEGEPKNLGDIQRVEPLNATEQFLAMRPSEFRDFLDGHWRKDKLAKVTIEVSERDLNDNQKTFLNQLEIDSRISVVVKQ